MSRCCSKSLSTAAGHLRVRGCTGRTSVIHHHIPSRWQVSDVLQISISFLLLFYSFTVSAELNQFSGHFPISLILQQTALRVRKGSQHIFKGTQELLAVTAVMEALAFPLFLKLLYSVFYCIWWGALKGSCHEVILEDNLDMAMLFLTLKLLEIILYAHQMTQQVHIIPRKKIQPLFQWWGVHRHP